MAETTTHKVRINSVLSPTDPKGKGLPKHWEIKKLGEVCFTTSGGTPNRRNSKFYQGNIPWVKSGELDRGLILDTEEKISEEAIKNSSAKVFPKGTLLIALYGATIGKLAFLGIDAATNQAVCGIYKNENIDSNYLFHFLFYKKPSLVKQGIGGAQPNISQGILKNLELPIPPIAEQQVIVAKIEELLSELENGKQQLQTAQQQLKMYRQSLLKWAFEGKLTKKNIKDGELPNGWKWVKLGSIATKITDGEHITPRRTSEGFLLLSARNIQNGYLALDNVDYVPEDEYLRIVKRCNPEPGDILISCSGTIGRVCRVPKDLKFVMVRSVALVKLDWSSYSSKFYEYLFLSPLLQRHIDKSKKATAQANLFLGPIKNLDVIVCPFEEQELIVAELESKLTVCDKIEETISQSLQQAETLRQSILKKAFEGKLV
jgi:type I restriction enzyme S subunit